MNEYIAKEDMRKAITDSISECQGSYDAVKRQHEIIDEMLNLPTVTKADICREFAEKVVELLCNNYLVGDERWNAQIDRLINEVRALAEKEQSND